MSYQYKSKEELIIELQELKTAFQNLQTKYNNDIVQVSIAEKAMRESEEKYRYLFANNPQPMLIYDFETLAFLEVNQAMVDKYGYTAEEFMTMTIKDIRPTEDVPGLLENIHNLNSGFSTRRPWRHKKKNGEIIPVENVAYSVNYNGRKARHVIVHDMTDQVSSEKEGHQAIANLLNERLLIRTLIDNIPDSIYSKDLECRKTLVNKAELIFMGAKTEAEVLGKNDFDFYPVELAEKFHADDQSVILSGKSVLNREEYILDEYGNKRWLLSSKLPLRDKDNQIIGLVGIGRDITDRKIVEEDLKENEERHRTILQTAMDGFWLFDQNGKMLEVNETYCLMSGFSEKEILNMAVPELVAGDVVQNVAERLQKVRMMGEDRFESLHRRKDGSIFYVEVSIQFQKAEGGRFVAFVHDITNRKRDEKELHLAKEKAEESDRLKSAFLANMSHEIRTPMNGILGFTELLKLPGLTGEQQDEYIQIIKKSGDRMLNIINDIVDISKIEAGQMELAITEANINEQLDYVYTFFKPEVEGKGMTLSYITGLDSKDAIIYTDREKLYAILTNLVKNAIKYSDGGSIEFGYILKNQVHEHASTLEFYVKDTGIGIPRNRQHAIFDRFVQADISDTRAFEGAGLGLSITRAYVEMLGGTIWVESTEGQGSKFYFTMPFTTKPAHVPAASIPVQTITASKTIRSIKILIAEDDETSATLITMAARSFAKQILRAKNGDEAVEICRSNPDIDLILMDIKMPGKDGYEATELIRQFNTSVYIIAQTAFGLAADKEKALKSGCDDYISKPINIGLLKNKIQLQFEK
ncbi:MAG: PAS domain S-box protein [Bacteroidales bacterium]